MECGVHRRRRILVVVDLGREFTELGAVMPYGGLAVARPLSPVGFNLFKQPALQGMRVLVFLRVVDAISLEGFNADT